jgi:23S rRNA pseudouridine2605 synthase
VQKVLARAGYGSRRQVEAWVAAGRLQVNGQLVTPGSKITSSDKLQLDGRPLRLHESQEPATLFICHRSPGDPLRPGDDPDERASLLDKLPRHAGKRFLLVSPMPRIDGGLELATADGELANRMQRAVRGVEIEFSARIRGTLIPPQLAAVLGGERDAGPPLVVRVCEPADEDAVEAGNRWYRVVTRGASGSDLRQVLERSGAVVSRILRVRVGGIELPRDLPRGGHRALPAEEAERRLLRVETPAADA